MSLYSNWTKMLNGETEVTNDFWNGYLALETNIYKKILSEKKKNITSTIQDFAKENDLIPLLAVGFLDGINESLVNQVELEKLEENSEFNIEIDFKSLYLNMLKVKAKWLYTLPEWENIYDKETLRNIKDEYLKSVTAVSSKISRNEPCPCGSGKKYKKCCALVNNEK